MALKNQILTTIQPTIPLREMSIIDLDTANQQNDNSNPSTASYAEYKGALIPMIRIAGVYTLPNNNVLNLTIHQDGFLPRINLTIYDENSLFQNVYYPVFDPILSVYIKSHHPNLKPLRCDFLITNINSSIDQDTGVSIYHVEGELYVPRLYNNVSLSYAQVSSAECLKSIATDLGLGYASNEEQLNDTMTWINPNMSYYTFIRDEVVKRAYKSDKSFFTCFIDRYYILNLINVEKQMEQDTDFDISYQVSNYYKSAGLLKDSSQRILDNSVQQEIILSNHAMMGGSVNHVREHKLISNNGSILKNDSFRKRIFWYDRRQQNTLNFFIEPLSNMKTQMGGEHQKPILLDLQNMEVKKWAGIDYGNAHVNNKFAQALNYHNMAELDKNILYVKLDAINPIIMRGSRIPVAIYNETYVDALKKAALGNTDQITDGTNYKLYLDDMLSDLYYVRDIIYKYDVFTQPDSFTTIIILAKRNWKKQIFS